MTRRMTVLVAALGVVAVLATACGSGRSDDASSGDTVGGDQPTEVASGTFGTVEEVCSDGDASGATDQGVTDTQVQIGYGDDAGFQQSPGLNHQMSDAMAAFIEWCNDAGGINGREIVGNYHDAAILDVNNAMQDACASDFFLVGQGFSLDSSQESVRRECGLPSVAGYAVSPQFANAPIKWEPFPIPADYTNTAPAAQIADLFPDVVTKASVMFGNYAATIDSKDKIVNTWPEFGYEFLDCPQEYNINGEASWLPFVQNLKDCGAELVYFVGSPAPNFQNVLSAAGQIDYRPIWYVDPNFYDASFRDWNVDGLADNVYMRQSYTPLEEADAEPSTQQFIDIMNTYGGDMNQLGQQSASAFLLWATAAKACGSDLTRECVGEQLDTITSWTGGGMHAEANPGENLPSECGLLLKMEGTSYVRVYPEEPGTYDCDPSYAAEVFGPERERANLDENRIAQL
jgi:ABC-type branched-subunit amino acid transport system substrate-binding protein